MHMGTQQMKYETFSNKIAIQLFYLLLIMSVVCSIIHPFWFFESNITNVIFDISIPYVAPLIIEPMFEND